MNLWREKRLLLAFRRRDPRAFDTLFARHAGAVLGFALRLTRGCHAEAIRHVRLALEEPK